MKIIPIAALLLAALPATAAIAQQGQTGRDGYNARVEGANGDVAVQASQRQSGQDMANADSQAQYQQDMEAYRRSLRAHDHAAVRDQVRYDRQQRAYADAMVAWRQQVYACHHGHSRACRAPTPNPANYY